MVLGLAVIAVAFMNMTAFTLTWTLVVIGAVVAILGFWGATLIESGHDPRARHQ